MHAIRKDSTQISLVFSRTLNSQSVGSVSIGSLAAYLRFQGFRVDMRLFDGSGIRGGMKVLCGPATRTIVIAKPNFKDFREMLIFLENLKKNHLVSRVFLCGPFAKLNAQGMMADLKWLDGVFVDQLEKSASALLDSMNASLDSWDFLSPGSMSRNPSTGCVGPHTPLTFAISLNDLPFPARDIEEDGQYVNIEASRGCLFNCSFCHIPSMRQTGASKYSLAIRDPVLVVDEMERLNKTMGKTLFIFNDSCFWSNKGDDERILRFAEEIGRRRLDVRFYIYLRTEPFISENVLVALVRAGLVRVFLGVENHVESSLAVYRKRVQPDAYTSIKRVFDQMGVNIHIGYITFEPYSTLDAIRSNVDYLFGIGKLFRLGVILEPVRVIPNSALHKQLIATQLMLSDLKYDEITYGYRFVHEEVGRLLGEFKRMFCLNLKGVAYNFEYHCTVGELLRVLAERHDRKFANLLKDRYAAFNGKKLRAMKLLLEYFRSSIACAKTGAVQLVGDPTHNAEFIRAFCVISGEIEVLYADIASFVAEHGGERAVREVYHG